MKRFNFIIILLVLLAFSAIAWADTVSVRPYGIATPKWYSFSAGEKSDYYLEHPTLTGNDQVVTEDATQTLTNKTLTSPTITGSTQTTATLTSPTINTGVSGTAILDDDTMATATDETLATAESIKAYVDTTAAADKQYLTAKVTDISTSGSTFVVCPIAGDITKIYSTIKNAITVGDAAITFEIAGVAVTDGAITIAYDGSAAGDVDSATPSAANTLTAGQAIEIISDGGSTDACETYFTFEITP